MSDLDWQKSTFSGGPQGECLNIATIPEGLAALLHRLKAEPPTPA
ncbi:hypothetical protein [Streptomyces sp. 2A115]